MHKAEPLLLAAAASATASARLLLLLHLRAAAAAGHRSAAEVLPVLWGSQSWLQPAFSRPLRGAMTRT